MPDGDLSKVRPELLNKAKDIEAWIQERRARWPTREKRLQASEAKISAPDQPEQSAAQPGATAPAGPSGGINKPRRQQVCRFFLKGSCKAGAKCKFAHPTKPQDRIYKRYEAPVRNSLFVKMLQSDLDAEDDQLVDFICYLRAKYLL